MGVKDMAPYFIAAAGILLDYVTTVIGLSMPGIYETHPQAHPLIAALLFFSVITILKKTMPPGKWRLTPYVFASISFLGGINNILVILGVFPGLVIPDILKMLFPIG